MTLEWAPVLADRLHLVEGLAAPDFATAEAPEVLARLEQWDAPVRGYAAPDVELQELSIPGPRGPVAARVYRPRGATPAHTFMWVHGGGFVFGDLDMPEADAVSREVCARGNVVVSVDYRKAVAGAHHPICLDDVYAAWTWLSQDSAGFPGTRTLGGASAGANLVAAAAQRARDEGAAVPASLLLIYPAVHAVMPAGSREFQAVLTQVPARLTFPPALMEALHTNYVGGNQTAIPYAWPGDGDLSGFPRTLILNCEYDSLRASGERLAEDLYAVGCDVTCVLEHGVPHGHLNIPGLPSALHSIEVMADFIEQA